jgi:hypothetical protein
MHIHREKAAANVMMGCIQQANKLLVTCSSQFSLSGADGDCAECHAAAGVHRA